MLSQNATLQNATLQNAALQNAALQNATLQNAALQNAALQNSSKIRATYALHMYIETVTFYLKRVALNSDHNVISSRFQGSSASTRLLWIRTTPT
jgi:uncharacterized protein YjbI with pentapeptide repeats